MRFSFLVLVGACAPVDGGKPVTPATTPTVDVFGVTMRDVGRDAGAQGWFGEHFQRGRSCAPADFDGDGDLDLYVGNPMDLSHILLNDTVPGEHAHFALGQIVFDSVQAWGASVADVDDDGDPDLHIQGGGNENPSENFFLRNEGSVAGGPLLEATEASGLVSRFADGTPFLNQSAGGQWADFDRDGLLDLYVSETTEDPLALAEMLPADLVGLNQLWRAQGDGTYVDVGLSWGLDTQRASRVSSVLDFDRDGWLDIFEHNTDGTDVLWRNTGGGGVMGFVDESTLHNLGGTQLAGAETGSWASLAFDANSDGWDDLLVFRRGLPPAGEPEVHSNGHMLFLNVEGSFVEVADYTHLNDNFLVFNHFTNGVMGCQAADLNADGYPDLVTGNGSPEAGAVNGLFLTAGLLDVEVPGVGTVTVPQYLDATSLTDFPAPEDVLFHPPGLGPEPGEYPSYPYRTHGLCTADFDDDGYLEVFEANGGPGDIPDNLLLTMQEPDRLWKVAFAETPPHWVSIRLVGGSGVNRDAIGSRVALTVGHDDTVRTLHQTKFSGSGFAASNGPELFFGLGDDDRVDGVVVIWPDGVSESFLPPRLDAKAVFERGTGDPVL